MRFRNCIRACAIVACLALLSLAAHAALPTYSAIYVFGDSYSDVGNAAIATGGVYPGSLYYNGMFSNGPIWIEHVAGAMHLPMFPSLDTIDNGTDYAVGGAWVTKPASIDGFTVPDVPQQVALYLSAHGNKADPKALYIIQGGGNDIIGNLSSGITPQALGFQIALGISGSELLLRQAGAKNFLISNLFDVGLLPAAQLTPSTAAFATAASTDTNQYVTSLLALEMLLEGIKIQRLDVFSLFQAVQTDPAHFGFTNITTPCLINAPAICADPDHTLFWDTFHPTEFGHSFIAVTVINALNQ
jgi:outer membrane lipase/esterase